MSRSGRWGRSEDRKEDAELVLRLRGGLRAGWDEARGFTTIKARVRQYLLFFLLRRKAQGCWNTHLGSEHRRLRSPPRWTKQQAETKQRGQRPEVVACEGG